MTRLPVFAAILLAGCVAMGPSPEQYDSALVAAIQDAGALRASGQISGAQGAAAHVYLRLQQQFPNMPASMRAYWNYVVNNAQLIDAGRATAEDVLTQAELRMNDVARQERSAANEAVARRMAAGFRAAAEAYKQPQQVNCQSYTSGGYTYTNCR